ncbi:ribose transport system ATP-binding protein [Actinoalloteichus hoggarensis]|uniref:Ribose import ATP-binding protein RbsA n=1 Tax=Actinoalloteichus hoggarensis TaxID=1470176 RepID=A0A221W5D6_9PSEU|nr:sugar ABC transporter ATP-binding protein [Actinoalloteichus hoggarensis]ASO20881.1 Ribose import ATP-binding protein RbsA [Actinoalloteichus hoggarensis]MBB5920812.1 ribose transport system ATP-binding protein [Actinoalloteichus hoggarensis]
MISSTGTDSPESPSAAAILETEGVTKSFGGVQALRGVDFQLGAGEIHALVGENGAGKSTLIKVLTGVHPPDDGEVRFAGDRVDFHRPADAQRAGISTIYQEVNLVPLLSVARNIFLGREPRTRLGLVDVARMNREAATLVESLGVGVDVRADLGRLGLGVQQMVALARAVSVSARVVIMDEPTSSLEAREVATLFGVARTLRDAGVGLVFVSHRLDELWELCDRVTILRDGRQVHTGRMADLGRLALISHMLGRDLDDVRRTGATDFGETRRQDREPVLTAAGLDVGGRLHGVGLAVRPGEVVGLGGLLGSGRTETVQTVYGALPREAGTVRVDGTEVRANSVGHALRSGIALLSEDRKAEGIIPELSVRENIALAVLPRLSRWGLVSESKVDALVATFMARLRIKASSPAQPVRELSGGNQQKVLIARWLCTEPKVFLLDEPTRGIDVGAKSEVQSLIDELAEQGLAVVLVSSEMEELVEGADRIVVLHDGGVVRELTGEQRTTAALLAALAHDPQAAAEKKKEDAGD